MPNQMMQKRRSFLSNLNFFEIKNLNINYILSLIWSLIKVFTLKENFCKSNLYYIPIRKTYNIKFTLKMFSENIIGLKITSV